MSDDTQTSSSESSETSSANNSSSDTAQTERDSGSSLGSARSDQNTSASTGQTSGQDAEHEPRDRGADAGKDTTTPRSSENGRDSSVGAGSDHDRGGRTHAEQSQKDGPPSKSPQRDSRDDLASKAGGQNSPLRGDVVNKTVGVAQKFASDVKGAASTVAGKAWDGAKQGYGIATAAAKGFASEFNNRSDKPLPAAKGSSAENVATGLGRAGADNLKSGVQAANAAGETLSAAGIIKAAGEVVAAGLTSKGPADAAMAGAADGGATAAGKTGKDNSGAATSKENPPGAAETATQKIDSFVGSMPGGGISSAMKTFGGDIGSGMSVSDAVADTIAKHAPFSNVAAEVDKAQSAAAKGDTAGAVQHGLNAGREFGQTVVSTAVGLEGGGGPKGPAPEPPAGGGPKPSEAPQQSPAATSVRAPENFPSAPTERAPHAPPSEGGPGSSQPKGPDAVIPGDGSPSAKTVPSPAVPGGETGPATKPGLGPSAGADGAPAQSRPPSESQPAASSGTAASADAAPPTQRSPQQPGGPEHSPMAKSVQAPEHANVSAPTERAPQQPGAARGGDAAPPTQRSPQQPGGPEHSPMAKSVQAPEHANATAPTERVPGQGPTYAEVRNGPPVKDGQRPSADQQSPAARSVRPPDNAPHAEQSPAAKSVQSPENIQSAPTERVPQGPTYAQVRDGPPVKDGQRPSIDQQSPKADSVKPPENANPSGPPTQRGLGEGSGPLTQSGLGPETGPPTQRGLGPETASSQSAAPPDGTRRELTPAEHTAVMEKIGQLEASGKMYQTNPDGSLARDGMGNAQLSPEARELRQQLNAHTEAKQQGHSNERTTSQPDAGTTAAGPPQGGEGWASGPWAQELGLGGSPADGSPVELRDAQRVDDRAGDASTAQERDSTSQRDVPLGPNGRDRPSL